MYYLFQRTEFRKGCLYIANFMQMSQAAWQINSPGGYHFSTLCHAVSIEKKPLPSAQTKNLTVRKAAGAQGA